MKFQQYTWYNRSARIDSSDTVHQVLALGRLEDILEIERILGKDKIREYFLKYPKKVYIKPVLSFAKNYILDIKEPIDERKYLKNTPRNLG